MANKVRFGTDGVRGKFNDSLDVEDAASLGRAAGTVLAADRWHIGRDTRVSGDPLALAFISGLLYENRYVVDLGVVPSGAVAHMSAVEARPGAMITASHNPFYDNGIKLFSSGGEKLSDALERQIELEVERLRGDSASGQSIADHADRGRRATIEEQQSYPDFVLQQLGGRSYREFKLAVDCANGSASTIAPKVLRAAGAEVIPFAYEPDGFNINEESGSTHIEVLQERVRAGVYTAGLAFDGDADRLLIVDETGEVVDGDQIMAVVASAWARTGRLKGNGLVATTWSNSGLRLSMLAAGIEFAESSVGDKWVRAEIDTRGYALGGEQSGHIIFKDLLPVGDGLLTAIEFLNVLHDSGERLSALVNSVMQKVPQRTINAKVAVPPRVLVENLEPYRQTVEDRLGSDGRLILRASGTEGVVRVMAEAPTDSALSELLEETISVLRNYEQSMLQANDPR